MVLIIINLFPRDFAFSSSEHECELESKERNILGTGLNNDKFWFSKNAVEVKLGDVKGDENLWPPPNKYQHNGLLKRFTVPREGQGCSGLARRRQHKTNRILDENFKSPLMTPNELAGN